MQMIGSLFTTLRNAFGSGGNAEDAWIDSEAALTPRERLIRRSGSALALGALLQAVLIVLLAAGAGLGVLSPDALGELFFSDAYGTGRTLFLIGLVGLGINCSLLLLFAAGVLAQEVWAFVLVPIFVVGNVLAIVFFRFYPGVLALIPALTAIAVALPDLRAFHSNAVSVKELRGRMRGVRSFAIITIFLLLMGSFTVLLYLLQLPGFTGTGAVVTGELGRVLFLGVVGIELMLIVFIVPALTAGAITGERERKTYDLLQTTLLSAPVFIVGKMESALGYILLLLLSAIPLQSIAFLFGGISLVEVGIAFVLLTVTALVLGAMGLFFSALTERTLTATVRVYTVAVVLIFALPIVSFLGFGAAYGDAVQGIAVNADTPLGETWLIYGDMLLASLNPVLSAFYTQQVLIDQQQLWLFDVQLATDGSFIPVIAPWVLTSILYVGITAALILLAVRRMRRAG